MRCTRFVQAYCLAEGQWVLFEHTFEIPLIRTLLFEEFRARLKQEGKREDIVILLAWLLSNFLDDGQIRSPKGARRKTIVLDGVTYWLVRWLK